MVLDNNICTDMASSATSRYSPRAYRFIQVVEAKRFEGVFLCKKKCAEFKDQTLKKSTGTQKCYVQRNAPGV